jgi:hypothetical protein
LVSGSGSGSGQNAGPPADDLFVSHGALAFLSFDGGASATAVDLATGLMAPLRCRAQLARADLVSLSS